MPESHGSRSLGTRIAPRGAPRQSPSPPAEETREKKAHFAIQREPQPRRGAIHVLVADDNADDLALCLRELKRCGQPIEARGVSTREEYQTALREAAVDVVVSDHRLSGWTGMDALADAKRLRPGVPLILLTGTLGDELAVECMKQGVTDYVLKDQRARLPLAIERAHKEKLLREAERNGIEALRQSEARYRTLVDNTTYGIYWVMPDGRLLFVNAAMAQMLGYDSADELLALENIEKIYPDPSVRQRIFSEHERTGRVEATVEWRRRDGKLIHVRLSGQRAKDPQRGLDCVEITAEDVSERVLLEKQLQQAQKFEGIGQLAGGIAHDFNNMIGAIMGWADLGLEETARSAPLRRNFERIRQQAERAAGLTRQLLAFARQQILEPRNMDLNKAVGETVSLLEKVIGSNIEVEAKLEPGLAVVRADPTQIEQVVMNLCINARDAMPNGGRLLIETANVYIDEQYCAFQPLARPGTYASLSITDSGTGMDAATLDRIFEPFFTTKELGKGTGLGLATVYGIVRQHGGFVQVYSEAGLGSTFRVYLPVSGDAREEKVAPEDSRPIRGGTETILLAEDHEGLRQLASETLTKLGYQVIAVYNGDEALRELQRHREQIALVLLDVVLPKLSGPEIYARLEEEKSKVGVIFVTGYGGDLALLQNAREAGLPVLQKPYSQRELARRVREVLDRYKR